MFIENISLLYQLSFEVTGILIIGIKRTMDASITFPFVDLTNYQFSDLFKPKGDIKVGVTSEMIADVTIHYQPDPHYIVQRAMSQTWSQRHSKVGLGHNPTILLNQYGQMILCPDGIGVDLEFTAVMLECEYTGPEVMHLNEPINSPLNIPGTSWKTYRSEKTYLIKPLQVEKIFASGICSINYRNYGEGFARQYLFPEYNKLINSIRKYNLISNEFSTIRVLRKVSNFLRYLCLNQGTLSNLALYSLFPQFNGFYWIGANSNSLDLIESSQTWIERRANEIWLSYQTYSERDGPWNLFMPNDPTSILSHGLLSSTSEIVLKFIRDKFESQECAMSRATGSKTMQPLHYFTGAIEARYVHNRLKEMNGSELKQLLESILSILDTFLEAA